MAIDAERVASVTFSKQASEELTQCAQGTFVAGIDVDGILRGKFVPSAKAALGRMPFCSVTFGWDCNDETYAETKGGIASQDTGFGDLVINLDDQRIFDMPSAASPAPSHPPKFVLGFFSQEGSDTLLHCCPRSLLRKVLASTAYTAKAGAEIEFYNFAEPSAAVNTKPPASLEPLSHGMHGYSALRPAEHSEYWTAILAAAGKFGIELDTWHSETGPGVLEAALKYQPAALVADQVTLFKYAVRTCSPHITPCFMAKPKTGMPGNSGHLHCSLWDGDKSVFSAKEPTSFFEETTWLSNEGHYFLGGLLEALPDMMLMFAPNVNSYRRLDPNFWAPVTESWGVDNRLASIRLIDAFKGSKSVRFEVRIPGADMVPHFALSAIYAAGYRGIHRKISPRRDPVKSKQDISNSPLLPCDLASAIARFSAPNSIAREAFGDDFVDHYAATRQHELNLYRKQVSDWEFKRYIETC